jgi:hypothetical protein
VGFFALGEVGDSEMRAGLSTIQQTLTPEATNVLNHSIAKAGRRNHGHMTPLHVAARSDPLSPISADEVLEQVVEVLDLVLSKVEYLKATDVVWFVGVVLLSSAWSGLGFNFSFLHFFFFWFLFGFVCEKDGSSRSGLCVCWK